MRMNNLAWACLVCVIAGYPSTQVFAEEIAPSYYLIGNSLTNDTVPRNLDGDVQYHIDCGKSLPYIKENPAEPCVKHSTLWPEALEEKKFTYFSMQPHYGSTLDEDFATIRQWIEMQPQATIIIHTGWARQESREEEYSQSKSVGKMQHSPAYFKTLLRELKHQFPNTVFRSTHAMDLLQQVAEDIENSKAPFNDISELYRDAIHMNVVTGRYLMHNAMRHAMDQPRSAEGFEKLTDEQKNYFDSVLDTLE